MPLLKEKKLDGFTREMLLREAYSKEFQLFDYDRMDTTPSGWAHVAMRPNENIVEHHTLYNDIRRFLIHDIHKETGLNIIDYFSLPRDVIDVIIRALGEKKTIVGNAPPALPTDK